MLDLGKIRMRLTYCEAWIWQHVTSDGRVITCSPTFRSRAACEADAMLQGIRLESSSDLRAPEGAGERRVGN
jgi:hypothetical protein